MDTVELDTDAQAVLKKTKRQDEACLLVVITS